MYLGYYESHCTQKNQLTFPSKFKELAGSELLLTTWFENSLLILPTGAGKQMLSQIISDTTSLLPEGRDLERFFYGNAVTVRLDLKNRFVLPAHLKDFAKIGNDATFVGVGERIELWDLEGFANYGKIREIQIRDTAINYYNRVFNQNRK